jgi:hypothetical protein
MSIRTRTLSSSLFLLVFVCLLLAPLFRGALYWGDIILYFEPMVSLQKDQMLLGRVPLWNPYILAGQPFIGNPQMWLFFPTTPLLYFFSPWQYVNLICGLSLWLCGVGCLLFLRRWVQSEFSALVGAMVYCGSACLVARLQFPPMVLSAIFFPLLLLFLDREVDVPQKSSMAWLAVIVALTVLAAHAQMAYLILGCGIVYTLVRLWAKARVLKPEPVMRWWVRRVMPYLVALGLGVGLCAVQVLPVLQLLRESPREEMTVKEANRFYLEPKHLLTLLSPHHFGHPATGDWSARGNAWEPAIYVGWLPLVFVGCALRRSRSRRVVWFWVGVAGASIWLAFGMHGGLFVLAFRGLPGLNKFHDPARFLFLTTFALAFLSAIGADISAKMQKRGMAFMALVLVATPLVWYGWEWNPVVKPELISRPPVPILQEEYRERGTSIWEETRLYMPRYRNLWRRYVNYTDYGRTDEKTLYAMQDTLLPNIAIREYKETINGYEPVPLYAPLALELLLNTLVERGEPQSTRLMQVMNATKVLQVPEERLYHSSFRESTSYDKKGVYAYHTDRLGRMFWVVRRVRRVEGKERVLAALSSPDFDPETEAIVSLGSDRKIDAGIESLSWVSGDKERDLRALDFDHSRNCMNDYSCCGFALKEGAGVWADMGEESGLFVTAFAAYPGWYALVDGVRTPIYRTNGGMIGVALPPGRHHILLRYEPSAYRVGLYVSCVAVMVWCTLWVLACLPRKRVSDAV